jgi:DNA-binding protein YbaB
VKGFGNIMKEAQKLQAQMAAMQEEVQMLEDLVLAAANEALRKSRELVQQELGKLTGGLKIPGLGM